MTERLKTSHVFDDNDLIGMGAFSKVYRSTKFTSGSTQTTAANGDIIDHAKRQKNILRKIQSEHICSYRQSLQSKNKFYMVQKMEEGTTLDKIILKNKKIDPKQVTKIAKAILKGLQYLHSKRIMHRDLKPANIMYDYKTGKAVLLDFGFATYFHKNDQNILTSIVGTPDYMSPEVMMGKKYNSLADVWSFGVILYELLCGELPFKGRSQKQILNCVLSKSLSFKSNNSPSLEWIITNCLKIDTTERMKWLNLFEWMDTGKLQIKRQRSSYPKQKVRKSFSSVVQMQNTHQNQNCECQIF